MVTEIGAVRHDDWKLNFLACDQSDVLDSSGSAFN